MHVAKLPPVFLSAEELAELETGFDKPEDKQKFDLGLFGLGQSKQSLLATPSQAGQHFAVGASAKNDHEAYIDQNIINITKT